MGDDETMKKRKPVMTTSQIILVFVFLTLFLFIIYVAYYVFEMPWF